MVGYGYEDVINSAVINGLPDTILETPEDVNQSGALDTYGAGNLGDGFGVANGDPTLRISCNDAWKKRVSGARHALKLVNGSLGNLPTPGFTVGSENPVYVQGDYNANAGFGDPHAAAAIVADGVTFLSNNWGTGEASDFLTPRLDDRRPAPGIGWRWPQGRTSPGPTQAGLLMSMTGWMAELVTYCGDWKDGRSVRPLTTWVLSPVCFILNTQLESTSAALPLSWLRLLQITPSTRLSGSRPIASRDTSTAGHCGPGFSPAVLSN